jgi:hypothetical protein
MAGEEALAALAVDVVGPERKRDEEEDDGGERDGEEGKGGGGAAGGDDELEAEPAAVHGVGALAGEFGED